MTTLTYDFYLICMSTELLDSRPSTDGASAVITDCSFNSIDPSTDEASA